MSNWGHTEVTTPRSLLLTGKDPSTFTLVEATQYGNLERCRELVEEEGVDVRQGDMEGITALHWAAINNRFAVARLGATVWER